MQDADAARRLESQIRFLLEVDKLKRVIRRTYLLDNSRRENSAEHSWHFALLAIVLAEHADNKSLDLFHVVKMALMHDLVEIDAGDVQVYDHAGRDANAALEQQAAERIFGLLPPEQGAELRALWDEFEAQATPEARFAKALDRLQPILHNYHTRGRAWKELGVSASMVRGLNLPILAAGSQVLADYVAALLDDAVAKGFLPNG